MNSQQQSAAGGGTALEFHASGIAGTEEVLCVELRELGLPSVRFNRGGIPFRGTWRDGWRACLQSRIAQRIHLLLARFPAPTPEMLYDGVREAAWAAHLTTAQTFSVRAVCLGSEIKHSGFAALKVKDAIVDHLRESCGERPDVSEYTDRRSA